MSKLIDISGGRFGRWTVLAMHPERYRWESRWAARPTDAVLWLCRCDCGTERAVHGNSLRRGRSKSCGCLQKERAKRTHGMSKTRIYGLWKGMMARCYNPNHPAYSKYHHRGYEPWKSFVAFRAVVTLRR
jgi:hypothetical protein